MNISDHSPTDLPGRVLTEEGPVQGPLSVEVWVGWNGNRWLAGLHVASEEDALFTVWGNCLAMEVPGSWT